LVSSPYDPLHTILRLEARVARLEDLLAERSRFLRYLSRELCEEDLTMLSRASCGLPPLPRPGFGLRGWRETTVLSSGDVDDTMRELWRSTTPPEQWISRDAPAPSPGRRRHG
jgi:hypothetical protein